MAETRPYIRDGAEIYRRSFAIIRAESDLKRFGTLEERLDQPRADEPVTSGNQDRRAHSHRFHGARPSAHRSLSVIASL